MTSEAARAALMALFHERRAALPDAPPASPNADELETLHVERQRGYRAGTLAPRTATAQVLARAEQLAEPGAAPAIAYQCPTCKDARLVRVLRDGVPHPEPCPACWRRHAQAQIDAAFPLLPRHKQLAQREVMPLPELPDFMRALRVLERLRARWPRALVILAGVDLPAYGTGKTHLLLRLWLAGRAAGKIVAYTSGYALEQALTRFDRDEEGQAAYQGFLALLQRADVLLIDEADRLTQRDGNGWGERLVAFQVVDHLLNCGKTVVMATNFLDRLHPALLSRAQPGEGGMVLPMDGVPDFRGRGETPDWMEG